MYYTALVCLLLVIASGCSNRSDALNSTAFIRLSDGFTFENFRETFAESDVDDFDTWKTKAPPFILHVHIDASGELRIESLEKTLVAEQFNWRDLLKDSLEAARFDVDSQPVDVLLTGKRFDLNGKLLYEVALLASESYAEVYVPTAAKQ